jgi:hypothetical protein
MLVDKKSPKVDDDPPSNRRAQACAEPHKRRRKHGKSTIIYEIKYIVQSESALEILAFAPSGGLEPRSSRSWGARRIWGSDFHAPDTRGVGEEAAHRFLT